MIFLRLFMLLILCIYQTISQNDDTKKSAPLIRKRANFTAPRRIISARPNTVTSKKGEFANEDQKLADVKQKDRTEMKTSMSDKAQLHLTTVGQDVRAGLAAKGIESNALPSGVDAPKVIAAAPQTTQKPSESETTVKTEEPIQATIAPAKAAAEETRSNPTLSNRKATTTEPETEEEEIEEPTTKKPTKKIVKKITPKKNGKSGYISGDEEEESQSATVKNVENQKKIAAHSADTTVEETPDLTDSGKKDTVEESTATTTTTTTKPTTTTITTTTTTTGATTTLSNNAPRSDWLWTLTSYLNYTRLLHAVCSDSTSCDIIFNNGIGYDKKKNTMTLGKILSTDGYNQLSQVCAQNYQNIKKLYFKMSGVSYVHDWNDGVFVGYAAKRQGDCGASIAIKSWNSRANSDIAYGTNLEWHGLHMGRVRDNNAVAFYLWN